MVPDQGRAADAGVDEPPGRVDELIEDLVARIDDLVAYLLDSARRGIPQRYRDEMADEHWAEHAHVFVPVVLDRLRTGEALEHGDLDCLRAGSRWRAERGLPLVVSLLAVRAGIGALGTYVVRVAGPQRLGAAAVVLGRAAMLSHDMARAAAAGYPPVAAPARRSAELAPVPRRILELAALGMPTREIARELHYSEQAVTYHLGVLMKQFAVPNRTALIARAIQRGVVELPEQPQGSTA